MPVKSLPNIELENQDKESIKLHSLIGDKCLVVFFYPKDQTLICTKEACHFRDLKNEFDKLNCNIVGISSDSAESHTDFIAAQNLNYALLADPENIAKKAFGLKNFLGFHPPRDSFLFDEKGELLKHIKGQFKSDIHADAAIVSLKKYRENL